MALLPLRTLLDHAAEHGYGVAAFNVNNMEQIQSIMEAADQTDSPVIIQASRGARAILAGRLSAASDAGGRRAVPSHSAHHAPGPWEQRRDMSKRHRERIHFGHDGWLAAGGRQDAGRLSIQRDRDAPGGADGRTRETSRWKGNWAVLDRWRQAWGTRRTGTARRAPCRESSC